MKTIALRFKEHFSPNRGAIAAHQAVIDEYGCVWIEKMGASVSSKVQSAVMSQYVAFSSKAPLGSVSRRNISTYYIIEKEDVRELGK